MCTHRFPVFRATELTVANYNPHNIQRATVRGRLYHHDEIYLSKFQYESNIRIYSSELLQLVGQNSVIISDQDNWRVRATAEVQFTR